MNLNSKYKINTIVKYMTITISLFIFDRMIILLCIVSCYIYVSIADKNFNINVECFIVYNYT